MYFGTYGISHFSAKPPGLRHGPGQHGGGITNKTFRVQNRRLEKFAWVWVFRGSAWVQFDQGSRHRIETGQSFLLRSGQLHSYAPEPRQTWDEWFVLFSGPVFELWQEHGLLPEAVSNPLTPEAVWQETFMSLRERTRPLRAVCDLQQALMKAWIYSSSGREQDLIERSTHLLAQYRFDPDPTERTAKELGLSHQTFRKRFRKEQGIPPGAYLRKLIMEEAAARILMEDISIKQLAEDLGFCDEFYFTRTFREAHGVPPATYRKQFL